MIRLALLLLLMCENVNAAPQAEAKVGKQVAEHPVGAAPFTLSNPMCQTGFTIAMRYDERDAAGAIIKGVWVRKCARTPLVVFTK